MDKFPLEPIGRGSAPAERFRYLDGKGEVGVIPSVTEPFCDRCDRIRLTAEGGLKTCLYDQGVLDVRALLRGGATDEEIRTALTLAFRYRAAIGFEAEQQRPLLQLSFESLSTIGG